MLVGFVILWLAFAFVVNKAPNYTRLLDHASVRRLPRHRGGSLAGRSLALDPLRAAP